MEHTGKNHIAYLEVLRLVACILVVGVHVSAFNLEQVPVESLNFKVMNGLDCLSILGVPLFVMISGALFLAPSYEVTVKKFYTRKTPKIVFLYFFWLLFYNVVNFLENGTVWNFTNVKKQIVLETLLGKGMYHMWYLPMLAVLYLLTPFLKSFAADRKKCMLFCALGFGYSILLPTALKFEFPYRTIVESLYNQFDCSFFGGYVTYYVLGHVLHEYVPKLSAPKKAALGLGGVTAMAIEIAVCNAWSVKTGIMSTILNTPFSVTAFIGAVAIFLLLRDGVSGRKQQELPDKASRKQTSDSERLPDGKIPASNVQSSGSEQPAGSRGTKICGKLAGLTLGIYLIHPLFLRIYGWLGGTTLFAPAVIAVPMIIVLITLVSGAAVYVLSKIPVVKKIVGR